jgi:A/G-specific adenine glycosylase
MMTPQPFQIQKRLLAWFDRHGRKHLPWQQNKTPYRVWVSEIMLQQTQANTVIPYFHRFMQQLPDLASLAHASIDTVLHLWAGLGYYSRARHLHRTAQIIMTQYAGQFPDTFTQLISLPGIGPSTAGAILAIAFNQQTAILDGNVKRVFARLYGLTDPINEKSVEKTLWHLAQQHTPAKRVADYTQAIMDFGATLCTPRQSKCSLCPFATHCCAYQQGNVEILPIKRATRNLPTRETTFLLIKRNQHILLRKRPPKGIWGGLWSLPEITGRPVKKSIRQFCQQHFHILITNGEKLNPFRHTFSHYHLDLFPVLIHSKAIPPKAMDATQQIWYNFSDSIGVPKPIQSLLKVIL